jgi:hypothetical protein
MSKRGVQDVVDRLLQALISADGPLSTYEVAKRSGVEWRTAERFLSLFSRFSEAGKLTRIKGVRATSWRLEKRHGVKDLILGPRNVSVDVSYEDISAEEALEALSKPSREAVLGVVRRGRPAAVRNR